MSKKKPKTKKLYNKSDPFLLKCLKVSWRMSSWTATNIWACISWTTTSFISWVKKKPQNEEDLALEIDSLNRDESSLPKVQKGLLGSEFRAKRSNLNELESLDGDLSKFESWIYSKSSTIGIILGARGSGKSAIGMFLLENFKAKSKKKIYALGFKKDHLPGYINIISYISHIKNNSVLLVDEGGVEFSSRSAMTNANKLLTEILLIARHKDLSVIFISQSSANIEINAIRQADYLLLKPSSLLQNDFERKKIKDIYKEAKIISFFKIREGAWPSRLHCGRDGGGRF